jgi:hypothetical protein
VAPHVEEPTIEGLMSIYDQWLENNDDSDFIDAANGMGGEGSSTSGLHQGNGTYIYIYQ